jgi:hypothetical protein
MNTNPQSSRRPGRPAPAARVPAAGLALASALALAAWAQHPTKPGAEGPSEVEAPGGTMLVYGARGAYYSLAPDGSSKAVEFSLADTHAAGILDGFSHGLHNGATWQLAGVCAVDGDLVYPDGGGRRYLYAESSEDHTLVRLTDDPDFEIEWWSANARPKWAPGDSRIYLVGFRWAVDGTTGEGVRVDPGLYHIDLPDDVSRLTAVPALRYAVPLPMYAVDAMAIAPDGDQVAFTLGPGMAKFPTNRPPGIYVGRASAGTSQLVSRGSASSCLAWSKAGNRIAFVGDGGRALLTMNAGGGEVRTVATVTRADRCSITSMCWSPADTHIGYSQLTSTNGREEVRHMTDVYRVPAAGGTPVNVTASDDSHLSIRAWY